ncbi:Mu transposase C-terminal domain-containing protein [Arcobacter cryaerophilus gv. pseudocryaerophilus]|uniref:Mu transposase C-terminal domain-containing protein n=3 Tax=unclassified Arcobacter TaxID=2593671 RepID=A0AA96DR79_9BACT|nr:Mu transposase C-terminal domain-containing protein [Arcobacter sp. AZ-2023]WPD06086.1 Mu transposase C-terminal domain-containing protein [Arcobacter sp. DSM 115956]WPD08178.1 Mu transposase C-terminal domain-containing protein [Arcobacter sp. DSM 115955]WNL32443.1 Mu transposase C-terminal domain-containing protein [Arcobacter sp. AZ-2023]WNP38593.1 Mu transposase C-terminal domain-containing protein [Arcobacter sp. AZ-2023]
MSKLKIKINEKSFYKNEQYIIVKIIDFYSVRIQSIKNPDIKREVLISELSSEENKSSILLDNITDEEWAIAEKRYEIIKDLLFVSRTKQEVIDLAKEHNIAYTTVYRWIKQYEENEQKSSLVPNTKNRGKKGSRLDTNVELIILNTIEELYLNKQRYSLNKIFRKIKQQCQAENLEFPHENTIRNRIKKIDPKLAIKRRHSSRMANREFGNFEGQFPDGLCPMDVIQIDHTPLDIILVDEKYRKPIGRPTLTLAIDVYSRMIAGFYLSLHSTGYFSVNQCLYNTFLPKNEFLKDQNVQGEWSIYGIPRIIHVDNGGELVGLDMERVCSELNITLVKRPVGEPQFGSHVERFFSTLKNEVHNLPGTTKSSIKDRDGYNSVKNASFTLKELIRWLTYYFVNIYHNTIHLGMNNTPYKQYEIGIFGDDENIGVGQFPDILENKENIRITLLPAIYRTIQRDGITLDGVNYYGDVLRHWINKKDEKGNKLKFKVKRDPLNIRKIYFFDPELEEYFEIYYKKIEAPEMTLWDLNSAKRYLKEKNIENYNENDIFEAYDILEQIEDEAVSNTRKAKLRKTKSIKMKDIKESNKVEDKPIHKDHSLDDLFSDIKLFDIHKK